MTLSFKESLKGVLCLAGKERKLSGWLGEVSLAAYLPKLFFYELGYIAVLIRKLILDEVKHDVLAIGKCVGRGELPIG